MNLTLTLLMLAREAAAIPLPPQRIDPPTIQRPGEAGSVVVELVPSDPLAEHGYLAVAVDQHTEELVIQSSQRTWGRLQAVFTDEPRSTDLVRILVPAAGAASRLASRLQEANPHLVVIDDLRTNTIMVSAGGEEPG